MLVLQRAPSTSPQIYLPLLLASREPTPPPQALLPRPHPCPWTGKLLQQPACPSAKMRECLVPLGAPPHGNATPVSPLLLLLPRRDLLASRPPRLWRRRRCAALPLLPRFIARRSRQQHRHFQSARFSSSLLTAP